MKAKLISGQAPGGKRTSLSQVLPLDTPFVVQIFPIYACNFKCCYCIFSVDKSKRHFVSDKIVMDFDLFKKCIDEMTLFPDKIKVLRFVGIGEPLLHGKIVDMVAYAVSKNVANIVEMLTNASLLNPQLSDALISAGLSRLVVSLQGITSESYQRVCRTDIDIGALVNNLAIFYNAKGNVQMYIKIIDCALNNTHDESQFYDMFGNICDTIGIEHAVPIHSGVDFGKMSDIQNSAVTQFGLPVTDVQICPQPFFHMQINPDGKIVPCYSFEYPGIMGDCRHERVNEIWKGDVFQKFRHQMLTGLVNVSEVCEKCNIIKYRLFPEDVLNSDAERLKKYYGPQCWGECGR
ncbi:MAG: radical SAM protein [Desulfatitalea sp.]|nr:radical SAM protein [Desulfatitalea sp.]